MGGAAYLQDAYPHETMTDPRLARLARIAPFRRRRDRDPSITKMVEETLRKARRDEKRIGSFAEAWERLVPEEIVRSCTIGSVRGSKVTVQVNSSSAKFELDRLLRSGLMVELRRLYSGPLTEVRTKLGSPGTP
jgi:hypothetical protein